MKKSNDTIGNRTRDLPACSAVLQPTELPHAPNRYVLWRKEKQVLLKKMTAQLIHNKVTIKTNTSYQIYSVTFTQ